MKTIGLIGGMSWESTLAYYRLINEAVKHQLGGLHSAKILLYSVDFHDIEQLQHAGQWDEAAACLADIAQRLEQAGADGLVLCTNTMHCVADVIENAVSIPLIHIADATAVPIKRSGIATVGLLGTRFTMAESFYRGRLESSHRLRVLVPEEADRQTVHRVIYDELCLGKAEPASLEAYRAIVERLVEKGAEGIIFGCTEIGLLLSADDSPVPVFDTTALHAKAAVDWALGRSQ